MLLERTNVANEFPSESLVSSSDIRITGTTTINKNQNVYSLNFNSFNETATHLKVEATGTDKTSDDWAFIYKAFDTINASLDDDENHLKTTQLTITLCFLILIFLTLVISIAFLCVHCFYSKKQKVSKVSLPYIINQVASMPQQPQHNQHGPSDPTDLEKKIYQWCQQKGFQNLNENQQKYKNYSKSMWVIGNLSSSKSIHDFQSSSTSDLNTTSHHKLRPQSTIDIDELYSKVNFSKKLKNRMSNNEAAIIAISRSKSFRSHNIAPDDSISVIYDERTAL